MYTAATLLSEFFRKLGENYLVLLTFVYMLQCVLRDIISLGILLLLCSRFGTSIGSAKEFFVGQGLVGFGFWEENESLSFYSNFSVS